MTDSYTVFLGIGSNLPVRATHINAAVDGLSEFITDIRESRRYESLPRYNENQPRFLNSVVSGATTVSPEALLEKIHSLEQKAGRNRKKAGWMGPRPLDIDILLAGELVYHTERLQIPHPRMYERKFVLLPLLELAPNAVDPISGFSFSEFFTKLEDQGIYYYSLEEFGTAWT